MNTLLQLAITVERLAPFWAPFLKETQDLDLKAADLAAELRTPAFPEWSRVIV